MQKNDELYRRLYQAVLSLRTIDEVDAFFEDLLTPGELRDIVQRLDVARRLHIGETYEQVAVETGASTTTISRVKRCLLYGKKGYSTVLDRNEDS